jgi:hypothetical protein
MHIWLYRRHNELHNVTCDMRGNAWMITPVRYDHREQAANSDSYVHTGAHRHHPAQRSLGNMGVVVFFASSTRSRFSPCGAKETQGRCCFAR